jgi:hypothetical protein
MSENNEKPRVTIVIAGGMVQNVFTDSESDLEVDVLDFDGNGSLESEAELKEKSDYLQNLPHTQRQIY